jgi:hypothetical protein
LWPFYTQKVLPATSFDELCQYIDPQYIPEAMGGQSTYTFNVNDYDDLPLHDGPGQPSEQEGTQKLSPRTGAVPMQTPMKRKASPEHDEVADQENQGGLNVLYVNHMSHSYGSEGPGRSLGLEHPDVLRSMSADTTIESHGTAQHVAHGGGSYDPARAGHARGVASTPPGENAAFVDVKAKPPLVSPKPDAAALGAGPGPSANEAAVPSGISPRPPTASPKPGAVGVSPRTGRESLGVSPRAGRESLGTSPRADSGGQSSLPLTVSSSPVGTQRSTRDDAVSLFHELNAESISPLSGDSGHGDETGASRNRHAPPVGTTIPPLAPTLPGSDALDNQSAHASIPHSISTAALTEHPDSLYAFGTEGEDVWHEVSSQSNIDPELDLDMDTTVHGSVDGDADRLVSGPFTPHVLQPDKQPEPLSEESYHYNTRRTNSSGEGSHVVSDAPGVSGVKAGIADVSPSRASSSLAAGSTERPARRVDFSVGDASPSPTRGDGTTRVAAGAAETSATNAGAGAASVETGYLGDVNTSPTRADIARAGAAATNLAAGPVSVDTGYQSDINTSTGGSDVGSTRARSGTALAAIERAANLSGLTNAQVQQFEADEHRVDTGSWEDVWSEDGGVDNSGASASLSEGIRSPVSGRVSPVPAAARDSGALRSPTVAPAVPRTVEGQVVAPLPRAKAAVVALVQRNARLQYSLSILWCTAVAATVVFGLYSARHPFTFTINVSATVLAQIILVLLLAGCFL